MNVYNKYCKISNQIRLFTRQSIKNLEMIEILVMLKIILKKFGSILTAKGKPL